VDPAQSRALKAILETQEVAALGTLHGGEPFVSMVPFALLPDATFVIHVSALAAHTRDMAAHPGVSLLVMANREEGVGAQALPRVTIQGDAAPLGDGDPLHAAAKQAYLDRFPGSAMTFGLGDFALVAIRPRQARFVGGFAQARSLTAEGLQRVLGASP
jgi:putative heme iron utilization protein